MILEPIGGKMPVEVVPQCENRFQRLVERLGERSHRLGNGSLARVAFRTVIPKCQEVQPLVGKCRGGGIRENRGTPTRKGGGAE
jgi:hypothetical protein